jgi:uncharacterized membrane protein YqiK
MDKYLEYLCNELSRDEYYDRNGYLNSEGRTLLELLARIIIETKTHVGMLRRVRRNPSRDAVAKLLREVCS